MCLPLELFFPECRCNRRNWIGRQKICVGASLALERLFGETSILRFCFSLSVLDDSEGGTNGEHYSIFLFSFFLLDNLRYSFPLSRLSTDVMIRNSLSLLKENRGNFLNRSRIPFLPSSRPHCQEEERAWRYYKWRSGRCVTECDWGFGRQLVPSSKWNPVIQSKHRCRTSERA